ncbi:RNA 3'-terminal phosphate cyclase [Daedaleopsis nitida]|nr:RNA 3'-terminal phosphate cyclase [Daedaleopsis nitida]
MASPDPQPVRIDGSVLEGGGQLLRISVALSALLSRPISIYNIRGKRTPPGLKFQHAAGLRLVADICNARLDGCETGSTSIEFYPQSKPQLSRSYRADPGTAGSIALLLQVSLPCLVFCSSAEHLESTLGLRGGTNASYAPQIDYTEQIFLPFLHKHWGLDVRMQINKRGYYPKGGGQVRVSVPAVTNTIPAITLTDRGDVKVVRGRSYVAGLPKSLADSMCNAAVDVLVDSGIKSNRIKIESVRERPADAVGSGSGIVLWAETYDGCIIGGSALGRKGSDPSQVGRDAAVELTKNLAHGGCVDEYLQDQIIVFLALSKGRSKVKTGPLTLHTRTAIWVAEQLTDARFVVQESENGVVIECDGIGYNSSPAPSEAQPTPS